MDKSCPSYTGGAFVVLFELSGKRWLSTFFLELISLHRTMIHIAGRNAKNEERREATSDRSNFLIWDTVILFTRIFLEKVDNS